MSQPQTVLVNRPTGAIRVAPASTGSPAMLISTTVAGQQVFRVQGPGQTQMTVARPTTVPATLTQGRNIVINQPGMQPGTPGSQITVPLTTLQGLQPGQGIPTGQAGHLLGKLNNLFMFLGIFNNGCFFVVKTDNGQYQILRVGNSSASASTTTTPLATAATSQILRPMISTQSQRAPVPSMPTTVTRPAVSTAAASSAASSMGQPMTPDNAKVKCKNFLATLLRLASEQPPMIAANVRSLIQGLIDGKVEPEVFTFKLQRELNSSPQPCLVPFLKKSLPLLQQSLRSGELTIEGVKAPGAIVTSMAGIRPQRPVTQLTTRPGGALPQVIGASSSSLPGTTIPRPTLPGYSPRQTIRPSVIQHVQQPGPQVIGQRNLKMMPSVPTVSPSMTGIQNMKRDKSGSSGIAAGDDDINDVAAMGGVNLAEESQRMQGSADMIGAQLRSCKDETFLLTGLLNKRISKICKDKGLEEPSSEVNMLMSHATQEHLKNLVGKLSVVADHRLDVIRWESDDYEPTSDIKGQLKFLSDLERLERRRHEEAEREMLIRAAKSRTKTEDPEKEKLKAKAKEMQRLEEEQLRHEKANTTALMAIGGPKKKLKLDDQFGGAKGGIGASGLGMRPRTKRVHMRDLVFLMSREKSLKHSELHFKSLLL